MARLPDGDVRNQNPGHMMASVPWSAFRAGAMVPGLFALAIVAGCNTAESADPAAHGKRVFTDYCQPCHNPNAGGNADIGAPAIASLSEWYIRGQLEKFQEGQRGLHFDDIEGMRMRPMSLALQEDGEREVVAKYVAGLPAVDNTHTVHGDLEAGAKHYVTCSACHGPDAKGNELLSAPSLVQQDDWYLERQIGKFQKGIRGANPTDVTGLQMAPMANIIKDEHATQQVVDQATKDVVAYIKSLSNQ